MMLNLGAAHMNRGGWAGCVGSCRPASLSYDEDDDNDEEDGDADEWQQFPNY